MKIIVENGIYYIVETSSRDSLENKLKQRLEKFDKKEVEMGIEVEREHDTDDELDVIKSNIDLLKVAIAHLEEDPHYYTKLKKVEESNKKHFTLDEGSGILTESPHISIGEKTIDLEFEKDKIAGLKKIILVMLKKEITDKHGSKFKLSSDNEVDEFIKKIMKNPEVRKLLA